jgi:hypothetical protein
VRIRQIEDSVRAVDLESDNDVVLAFKLALWTTCAVAARLSFRAVRKAAA